MSWNRSRSMYWFLLIPILFLSHCKNQDDPKPVDPIDSLSLITPVAVTKSQAAKVYVHLMPWFESPTTSGNGKWGSHWTMANKNPDVIVDAETDKRQIASHFYPLTGPYASSDTTIIEYQVLLMKLAGIDGVLIDWYGTLKKYDYPNNLRNTEAFMKIAERVGLSYAIVYEDAIYKSISDHTTKITDAQNDMTYIQNKYFNSSKYINIDSKPLLMTFGPQTFQTSSDWTSIFSGLTTKPKFLTLWYESGEAGANAGGEFSWVYQDSDSHLTHLDNFYANASPGFKMGSAYPGFKDFYTEGGWNDNVAFSIEHNDTITFHQTLTKALDHVSYIQLVTWNDYGEGTMIEPTFEFGYRFLTTLQADLGVDYTQSDLELVHHLYELRKANSTSIDTMRKLDWAAAYIASLQLDKAREILNQFD